VEDSDEFTLVSLTRRRVNWAPPAYRGSKAGWLQELRRIANIRRSMQFFAGANRAVLRRDLFRVPIRWHSGDLDEAWQNEEERIERQITRAVGDFYLISQPPYRDRFPSRATFLDAFAAAQTLLRKTGSRANTFLSRALELSRRIALVLTGNPDARRWLIWRMHVLWQRVQGQNTHPPRPDVP
jgi:hypothetical protein